MGGLTIHSSLRRRFSLVPPVIIVIGPALGAPATSPASLGLIVSTHSISLRARPPSSAQSRTFATET